MQLSNSFRTAFGQGSARTAFNQLQSSFKRRSLQTVAFEQRWDSFARTDEAVGVGDGVPCRQDARAAGLQPAADAAAQPDRDRQPRLPPA